MTEPRRIPALDGLRGLAILLVLLWHYLQNLLRDELGPAAVQLKRALALSWSGVDLFFVLSGFLIAGLLLDHRGSERYFRTFYIRRVCRIFPLYYAHLALFALVLTCLTARALPTVAGLLETFRRRHQVQREVVKLRMIEEVGPTRDDASRDRDILEQTKRVVFALPPAPNTLAHVLRFVIGRTGGDIEERTGFRDERSACGALNVQHEIVQVDLVIHHRF